MKGDYRMKTNNPFEIIKDRAVLFDGAMGTMLEKYGIEPGELPETWNLGRPEVIRSIHEAYLDAGADVITANTFGCSPLKYDGETLGKLVAAGLRCARDAADESERKTGRRAFVALDVGPTGRMLSPLGDLDFEDAVRAFSEVVRLGEKYGANLVLIETMSDSYETKAAALAAKESCSLPVFVTNVYDESSRLMTGADPSVMAEMLCGLGVDGLGVNCGFGPEAMKDAVRDLLRYSRVPVIVNPNAGLPSVVDGATVYDVLPGEFAASLREMVKQGVRGVGGCCGTTPEYIKTLSEAVRGIAPPAVEPEYRTAVTSGTVTAVIGQGVTLIGERINPTGKKKVKEALRENDFDYLLDEAIRQEAKGAQILDVNAGLPEIDEPAVMERLTGAIGQVTSLPLQIDSSDPEAVERALRRYNGKAMINSVNGKDEVMERLFPVVKKYGGVVVGLTLDEGGIPDTAEGRLAIAEKIVRRAAEYGIDKRDIVIDPLVMAVSADPGAAAVTLRSVRLIKEKLGVGVSLGVSNVSFGLPERDSLNAVFFAEALSAGLDAAIMNPYSDLMMTVYRSHLALTGRDTGFAGYIAAAESSPLSVSRGEGAAAEKKEGGDTLFDAVVSGLSSRAAELAKSLLESEDGTAVIDREIIPALDKVGEQFENRRIYLPQLLMSAEAAASAFGVIKEKMEREGGGPSKGEIVLATVKGDIHDIGKNIVGALLRNFGYTVIDLGRDVPPEVVAREARERSVRMVGLSALMTTTVPSMEETITLLRREAPGCVVMVGGAVLTPEYAEMIGADRYCRDAMAAVNYAKEIFGN